MTTMMHYGVAPCGCMVGILREQDGDLPHQTYQDYLNKLHLIEEETRAVKGTMKRASADDVVRLPMKCKTHTPKRPPLELT